MADGHWPQERDYEKVDGLTYAIVGASGPDSPRNDTASVARLGNGDWMVVWHQYRASEAGTSDFGIADIASKISTDAGKTWGQARILVACNEGDNNVQAPALRWLRSGDVLLICLRGHAGGKSSTMEVHRSVDGGQTFACVSQIWEKSAGQWLQGGASCLLELQSGRLLLPCHGGTGHQGSQHNIVHCYYSDDGGATWQRNAQAVDLPMRGAMEASVAELPDGELVMSLRTQLGAVFLCRSVDGGESWSHPQTTGLKAPESCTNLRCVPGCDDLILLWNDSLYDMDHHHYGLRTPLSVALSQDRGHSWRKIADLAHRDKFSFTNLGCDFVTDDLAVVTYCAYGPERQTERTRYDWLNPAVFDLHSVVIDKDWIYK